MNMQRVSMMLGGVVNMGWEGQGTKGELRYC